MKRLFLSFLIIIGASLFPAYAQEPVRTQPYGVTSQNFSSTVASTNTFQSILAAATGTPGRTGCVVQNISSRTQYVFFGPIASALTTNSMTLSPGATVYCNVGGIVLRDQVSITGTSGDRFFAAQQ